MVFSLIIQTEVQAGIESLVVQAPELREEEKIDLLGAPDVDK